MNIARVSSLIAALAFFFAVLIGAAKAESELSKKAMEKIDALIMKLEAACEADLEKYCSKVTPGEGRLLACLASYDDQISKKCYRTTFEIVEAVDGAATRLFRAADACDGDVEKFCAKVEPGDGRIADCLLKKESELAKVCQTEVLAIQTRLKAK